MKAHLELLRLNVCLLALFGVLVGALVGGLNFPLPFSFIIGLVVTFLICGAGNVINDYFDYEVDVIGKQHRPIPSGRVTREGSKLYAGFLFLAGNILAAAFLGSIAVAFCIVNSVIIFAYSWKLKGMPIGHFVDAWFSASTFIFGGILLADLNSSVLILASIAFFATVVREIAKGIEDYKADRTCGKRTLEVSIGKRKAGYVAIIAALITIILSILPYYSGVFGVAYLLLIIFTGITFVYSIAIMHRNPRKAQICMKIGMFIAIFAFLVGVFF